MAVSNSSGQNYEDLTAFSESTMIVTTPGVQLNAVSTTTTTTHDPFLVTDEQSAMSDELLTPFLDLRNITFDLSHSEFNIFNNHNWQICIVFIYILVIAISLAGNVLVIHIIFRNKHLHNITNIFVVTLAISDIVLCVFYLPFQLHYKLTDNWFFGRWLCHVIMPTFAVPVHISTLSILVIAVNRYILLLPPFKQRVTPHCAFILLVIISLLSFALSVPLIFFAKLYAIPDNSLNMHFVYCGEAWPSIPLRRAYRACVFLFQFCLPLLITVFLYFRIYFILKRRSFKKLQNSHRHRTNKALMTIVLLFTICWLPWNIFVLLDEFDYEVVRGKFFKLTDLLLKILAISSACINPILYAWLNDNFQKELDHIVGNSSSKDEDCLPTKEGHTLLQPSPSATQTSSTYSENSTTNFC